MTIVFDGKTRTITYDTPKALEHIANLIYQAPEWKVLHPEEQKDQIPIEKST